MASASRLALACDTCPDSTASRTAGAAPTALAVLTRPTASRRDKPAASASTCTPPSPWRSTPATIAAADVWVAVRAAAADLHTASTWRASSQDTEDPFIADSISLAAASNRRAASINMMTSSHRGVTSVKYLQVKS